MIQPVDLISPAYRAQQRALHMMPEGYGGKGSRWADTVAGLCRDVGAASVLDYGCGQGSLGRALAARGIVCREYDPAIPGKDDPPVFADVVVCTDVLEHVERDKIAAVLTHIRQLARKAIFVVVCLRPSNKVLDDGRNAHILLEPKAWWNAAAAAAGWELVETELLIPAKVDVNKQWIVVAKP